MTRNLKVLGLALVAAFALSAVVASAASAQGKITSDGPVTLKGEDEGGAGANFFKFPGLPGQVECPGSTYTGHRFNITPHEVIPVNSTTATITPKYNNATCTANGLKATVTMEGCDFVFHLGATTASPPADEYGVTADLVCPVGKNVIVHLYASATSEAVTLCTLTIKAQNGITGLDIINEVDGTGKTNDTITITGTSKNIKASRAGACGASETAVAEYKATVTIKGFNAAGGETGVTITD